MVKNVVVLGAGFAGTAIAGTLDKSPLVNVTIVDRCEVMVHKFGSTRGAVNEQWADAVLIPRGKLMKKGKFVQAGVESVSASSVTLDNGETLDFDYLVCATGSHNASPCDPPVSAKSKAEMIASFAAFRAAVAPANDIVLVGGGVVAVELAGELKHANPTKTVTIVGSSGDLAKAAVPTPASYQKTLHKELGKAGVNVIVKDKVTGVDFAGAQYVSGMSQVTLASGKTVKADLVVNCVGSSLNSSFYPAEWKNERGQVKVDDTLLVQGTANVFAAGDLTDLKEAKMGYGAMTIHAPVVAANILKLVKGGQATKKRKPPPRMMIITVGPKRGVMLNPMGTLGAFMASTIKGKGMFLAGSCKLNNAPAPKV